MMYQVHVRGDHAGADLRRVRRAHEVLGVRACSRSLWATLVYDPIAHWVWGPDGWLAQARRARLRGRHRRAPVVGRLGAGRARSCSASASAIRRRAHAPHNLTMTVTGAGLLWFGWFGFNAGCGARRRTALAALAFVNTHLAAAAGALAWALVEWRAIKKVTMLGVASGLVAGLVAITPAAGYVSPMAAHRDRRRSPASSATARVLLKEQLRLRRRARRVRRARRRRRDRRAPHRRVRAPRRSTPPAPTAFSRGGSGVLGDADHRRRRRRRRSRWSSASAPQASSTRPSACASRPTKSAKASTPRCTARGLRARLDGRGRSALRSGRSERARARDRPVATRARHRRALSTPPDFLLSSPSSQMSVSTPGENPTGSLRCKTFAANRPTTRSITRRRRILRASWRCCRSARSASSTATSARRRSTR